MKTASDNESSSFISSVSDPNSFSPDAESDDDASLFSSKAGMEDDDDNASSFSSVDENDDDDNKSLFSSVVQDDDDESRFSEEENDGWLKQRPPERLETKKKLKKENAKTLVTEYNAPPEERNVPDFYYLAHVWGFPKSRVVISTLGDGPPPEFLDDGKYQIIVSDLVKRKGKGFHEDRSM
jgi:hypothetical protein